MKLFILIESIKDLLIIYGTGYVVFGLGYSAWWFVMAVLLIALTSFSYKKSN